MAREVTIGEKCPKIANFGLLGSSVQAPGYLLIGAGRKLTHQVNFTEVAVAQKMKLIGQDGTLFTRRGTRRLPLERLRLEPSFQKVERPFRTNIGREDPRTGSRRLRTTP